MAKRRSKKEQRKIDEFLATARKRFHRIHTEQNENRDNAKRNLEFVYDIGAGQWPEGIKEEREAEMRPCLTSNKLRKFVALEANMERDQRLAGNVRPVDDVADPKTAQIIAGMIRQIEYSSNAEEAYTLAGEKAIAGGFPGYFRIVSEEVEHSFEQELFIRKIDNQFSVYLDRKGRYGFVREGMSVEDFKAEYPGADAVGFNYEGSGEEYSLWWEEEKIFVAEYFWKEPYNALIAELIDLRTGARQVVELPEGMEPASLMEQGFEVGQTKEMKSHRVRWAKISGVDILEEGAWAGKAIPIIEVKADEVNINGKTYWRSLIEDGKGPQQAYNYWLTHMAETVALVPKAPYIAATEQIAEHISIWESANQKNHSILPYTHIPGIPKPERQSPGTVPTGSAMMLQISAADIQDSIGKYEASFGEKSNERTGVAMRQRAGRSDFGTYHFRDNFRRAILECTRQLIEVIPKYYDTERMVRILDEEGNDTVVPINQAVTDVGSGETVIVNDLTVGKYDVRADVKVWSTRRQEAADSMAATAQAMPNLAPLFADLIFKFNDWPGADIISKRIADNLPSLLGKPSPNGEQPPGGNQGEGI